MGGGVWGPIQQRSSKIFQSFVRETIDWIVGVGWGGGEVEREGEHDGRFSRDSLLVFCGWPS